MLNLKQDSLKENVTVSMYQSINPNNFITAGKDSVNSLTSSLHWDYYETIHEKNSYLDEQRPQHLFTLAGHIFTIDVRVNSTPHCIQPAEQSCAERQSLIQTAFLDQQNKTKNQTSKETRMGLTYSKVHLYNIKEEDVRKCGGGFVLALQPIIWEHLDQFKPTLKD